MCERNANRETKRNETMMHGKKPVQFAGRVFQTQPQQEKSGSGCGANAQGGGGFQTGNKCGGESGGGGGGAAPAGDSPKAPAPKPNIASKLTHEELTAATKGIPYEVKHEGKTYSQTGKMGTDFKTGKPSREFEVYDKEGEPTGQRVWVDTDKKVKPD